MLVKKVREFFPQTRQFLEFPMIRGHWGPGTLTERRSSPAVAALRLSSLTQFVTSDLPSPLRPSSPRQRLPSPSAPAPSRGAAVYSREQMGLQGQGRRRWGRRGERCKDQNPKLTVAECGRLPPGSRPRQLGWKGQPRGLVCKAPGEFVNKPSNFRLQPEIWILRDPGGVYP